MIVLGWVGSVSAAEPCYGWQLDNHVEGKHLSVQWDDMLDQDGAEAAVQAGDAAWDLFTAAGFPAPAGVPSVLFQVDPLGRGGFTDTVACDDTFVSRMYVFYDEPPGSHATLAHELFHAVQYGFQPDVDFIGNYYIWPWWAEGTAEWSNIFGEFEGSGWPDAVSSYLATGHLALHQDATAFVDPERSAHMYGTALLAAYLATDGGPSAIVETFQVVDGMAGTFAWFPDVITATGRDWDTFWRGYLAVLPTLALPIDAGTVDKAVAVSTKLSVPADGGSDLDHPPQSLGFAYHTFEPEVGPSGTLRVSFSGDPAARWHVVLVRTAGKRTGSEVLETVALTVDADGVGQGDMELDGEHPIFLVVSPEAQSEEAFTYTWTAEGIGIPVVEATGCGCATGRTSVSVVALGIVWWWQRRRQTERARRR